jgi:hypothetical protein
MTITLQIEQKPYRFTAQAVEITSHLERINKYKKECGCTGGAISTTCALIAVVVRAFLVDWGSVHVIGFGLSSLLLILLSAGVGKLVGIGIARVKLRRLTRSLISRGHLEPVAIK